jgi:hypothetical protein
MHCRFTPPLYHLVNFYPMIFRLWTETLQAIRFNLCAVNVENWSPLNTLFTRKNVFAQIGNLRELETATTLFCFKEKCGHMANGSPPQAPIFAILVWEIGFGTNWSQKIPESTTITLTFDMTLLTTF